MQRGRTAEMIFDVPTLVSYISGFGLLMPGDLICTGTPPGVGAGMRPPRLLRPGDEVTLGITGLGARRSRVVPHEGRLWMAAAFEGRFAGRVAVVTGGAQGIGAAVAERLLAEGACVALWDLDVATPDPRVAGAPEGRAVFVQVDVADPGSVEAALRETERTLGSPDVLVNSAGIAGPTARLADYPFDAWRKVQAVNLDGTFHCCRALVPGMEARGYGRIVNIASIAGKEGNPGASAYSASKAAVIALTKSLGKELAGADLAVNCVTPATARTRILEQVSQEFIDYMLSKIPRARFVTVEEVAAMVCFLASAENSFATGAVFDLSGGRATY